ncbi:Cobalamin-5-phosphate synthase [Jiangella alba]|uniref:Cobalamin-5-phosphate synthase n=1 Tax=Jiangella alba TaxID=561176 RepID=A0A1H5PLB9_9ACTN|nr:Cobalamin-5-phosphate synthase [Jiangella alba]
MIGALRAAVGFLTRIPVGPAPFSGPALDRAGAWFPLVGVVVGGPGWASGGWRTGWPVRWSVRWPRCW